MPAVFRYGESRFQYLECIVTQAGQALCVRTWYENHEPGTTRQVQTAWLSITRLFPGSSVGAPDKVEAAAIQCRPPV